MLIHRVEELRDTITEHEKRIDRLRRLAQRPREAQSRGAFRGIGAEAESRRTRTVTKRLAKAIQRSPSA
jgi:hypothetical protein